MAQVRDLLPMHRLDGLQAWLAAALWAATASLSLGEGLGSATSAPLSLMEDFLVLREKVLVAPPTDGAPMRALESRLDGLARVYGLQAPAIPLVASAAPTHPSTAPASARPALPPPRSDLELQVQLFLHKGYALLARKGGELAARARLQARAYLGAFRPKTRICTYLDSGGIKVIFRGDPNAREIALTFDDGPIEGNSPERGTRAILKILADTGSKGTFFMCGSSAKAYPKLVREIAQQGHSIANHTKSHARGLGLPRLSLEGMREEVGDGKRMIQHALGPVAMPLFRLPYGAGVHTARVNKVVGEYHDFNIYWTIDTRDWQKKGYAGLVHAVLDSPLQQGSIVLFHDHGIDVPAAIRTIITTLKPKGYRFITVDEMLGIDRETTFLEGFERAAGEADRGRDQAAYALFLRAANDAPTVPLAREALDFAYLLARMSLGLQQAEQARSLLVKTFATPSPAASVASHPAPSAPLR